jgi:hypothetical protein
MMEVDDDKMKAVMIALDSNSEDSSDENDDGNMVPLLEEVEALNDNLCFIHTSFAKISGVRPLCIRQRTSSSF